LRKPPPENKKKIKEIKEERPPVFKKKIKEEEPWVPKKFGKIKK
jgi:hypothetical protein